jgi:hypothetical protein
VLHCFATVYWLRAYSEFEDTCRTIVAASSEPVRRPQWVILQAANLVAQWIDTMVDPYGSNLME